VARTTRLNNGPKHFVTINRNDINQREEKEMNNSKQMTGEMTMKFTRIMMRICFLLALAGNALAQKVSVDADKGTDFTKYQTYAFAPGTPAGNPMINQRIIAGLEAQLASKGLRKVESNPDLVIVYHVATDTQVSINAMGGGPFGGWRFGAGTAYVDKVPVGQLVVDIGDPHARRFVWRGTASGTISSKQEKNEKALNSALAKMFQNFPQPAEKK
jgi:hypothetical protein